jgi:hypothetical protein
VASRTKLSRKIEALCRLLGELDCNCSPRGMWPYLFSGSLHLDYDSAIKADVTKQNYSVQPRQWYIDATIRCAQCGDSFCFSANEQKVWYEEYGFYVDSFPTRCNACRREQRDLKALRQEYDRDISGALASDDCDLKARMVTVIDRLCEVEEAVPVKVHENRKRLAKQIARQNEKSGPKGFLES